MLDRLVNRKVVQDAFEVGQGFGSAALNQRESVSALHAAECRSFQYTGSLNMVSDHLPYTDLVEKLHFIRADWDPVAGVWVATSDDVPGLATEADTLEALSEKLQHLVPELLEANGEATSDQIQFELLARRLSVAQRATH